MPAHARLAPRATAILAIVLAVVLAAGCGPPPPQAPVAQANRVASAIAGISAACGESYQQHAARHQALETAVLENAASERVQELADVYKMGPQWIYDGDSLREIVALAVHDLRQCNLPRAAEQLLRQTS